MKVLLVYLQPKDGLDEVTDNLKEIPCDKLILKYFPYPMVYQIANKTILEHPEYTHILWLQNDIVLTVKDFNKMLSSHQSARDAFNSQILGVSMNVDLSPRGMEEAAYTTKPFHKSGDSFLQTIIPWEKKQDRGIIKVFHNGGPFIAERPFYLMYPLTGYGKTGYNADILQGMKIHEDKIPYYLDTSIHLKHLRFQGKMMIGKKPMEVQIVRY